MHSAAARTIRTSPAAVQPAPASIHVPMPNDLASRRIEVERAYAYGHFKQWLAEIARTYSQRAIAARSGVDHSTVSRLVKGERVPTLYTAQAIIEAFIH